MSEGLESLERYKDSYIEIGFGFKAMEKFGETWEYKKIEKELKALEIIYRKGVNVGYLKDAWEHNKKVNYDKDLIISVDTMRMLACGSSKNSTSLTQEEYKLLKEVYIWTNIVPSN